MLPKGSSLGPYRSLQPIGVGGMGEVYCAHDPRLNRSVALKVLRVDDHKRRALFEREALAVAALNHPNIVTIYSVEEADGVPFLTMELVSGKTLAELIPKDGMSLARVLEIGVPLADALAAAHSKGITHRDLKPANVMIGADGRVKILDFGLAKLHAAASEATQDDLPTAFVTREARIVGTAAYMSPEQAEGEGDSRSDIFSLGVILYELAAGQRPFTGTTSLSVITSVMRDVPTALTARRADLPRELDRIVRRCLAKNPERRYQDTRDLRNDLEDLRQALESGDLDSTSASGRTTAVARTSNRERLLWAVALTVVAGLGGWLATRRSAPAAAPLVRLSLAADAANPASGYSVSVSPDGTRVAYVASGKSGQLLWLRLLSEETAKPLPGTEGADELFWSPDGRSIGFFTPTQLKRIDLGPGSVRTLADIPSATGGTWGSEGTILFAEAGEGGLRRVAATGGPVETVRRLRPPEQVRFQWPWFLPDGKRYLYAVQSGDPATAGTYVASLEADETHRILDTVSNVAFASGSLFYVHTNALVAQPFDLRKYALTGRPLTIAEDVRHSSASLQYEFSASETGVVAYRTGGSASSQLTWLDRAGRQLSAVGPIGEYLNPELAPDGKQAAIERSGLSGNRDIWLIDLARDAFTRFTFDQAMHYMPVWSPDGKRLAYAANPDARFRVYVKETSGAGGPQVVYTSNENAAPYDWSRDGRTLLFRTVQSNGVVSLGALSMTGERKATPISPSEYNHATARLSPNGRWVSYFSNESGVFEVYAQGFPDPQNGKWQVSKGGGLHPRWRADGRELFYISPNQKLMSVGVTETDGALVFTSPTPLFDVALASGTGGVTIGLRHQYDVASDGQRFLVNLEASTSSTAITVLLNWFALTSGTGAP
jgi:Tol biopolymer transport system component